MFLKLYGYHKSRKPKPSKGQRAQIGSYVLSFKLLGRLDRRPRSYLGWSLLKVHKTHLRESQFSRTGLSQKWVWRQRHHFPIFLSFGPKGNKIGCEDILYLGAGAIEGHLEGKEAFPKNSRPPPSFLEITFLPTSKKATSSTQVVCAFKSAMVSRQICYLQELEADDVGKGKRNEDGGTHCLPYRYSSSLPSLSRLGREYKLVSHTAILSPLLSLFCGTACSSSYLNCIPCVLVIRIWAQRLACSAQQKLKSTVLFVFDANGFNRRILAFTPLPKQDSVKDGSRNRSWLFLSRKVYQLYRFLSPLPSSPPSPYTAKPPPPSPLPQTSRPSIKTRDGRELGQRFTEVGKQSFSAQGCIYLAVA